MYRTYEPFLSLLTILGVLSVAPAALGLTTAFHGRHNGDWGIHANWTNGVPGSGDTAIINAYPLHPLTTGLFPEVTDLAAVIINDGYGHEIGTDCQPLSLNAQLVRHAGKATLRYFNLIAAPGRRIIVDSDSKHTALRLDGKWVAQVEVLGGGLILTDRQGGIGHLIVTRNHKGPDNATAVISASKDESGRLKDEDPRIAQLTVTAGQVWIAGTVDTCLQTGGEIRFKGPTARLRYLELTGRGAIFHNRVTATGALGTAHIAGGIFDAQGNDPDNPYRVGRLLTWPQASVLGRDTLDAKVWVRIGE